MLQLLPSTLVNRKIPKNKFYEKLHANHQLRELFSQQVESIIWKHKLSQESIHLAPKGDIEEIQVFEIQLKQPYYSQDILQSIDKAIPYPILYVMTYALQSKLVIAYKQRNHKDENKFVVRTYHESDWGPLEELEFAIVQGLDLEAVYENIIRSFLTVKARPEVDLEAVLERQTRFDKLSREGQRLESKIRSEKQFNRKVELNLELLRIRKELRKLMED